jgi:hypothetical protein
MSSWFVPPFAYIAIKNSSTIGSSLRPGDDASNIVDDPADSVATPAIPLGNFPLRKTFQKIISRDGHLSLRQLVAVPQTANILAVHQPPAKPVNLSSDSTLAEAKKAGNLPKAVAVLDVHDHHDLLPAFKKIQPAPQQFNLVAFETPRQQHLL